MANPIIDAESGQVIETLPEEKCIIPPRYVNLGVALLVGFVFGYAYRWDKERSKSKKSFLDD